MNKSSNNHTIDVVFVLAVACAFAASVLMVLMLGVNTYGSIRNASNTVFNERICLSYITAKIHGNDSASGVRTDSFTGISSLYIDNQFDGVDYNTIIYAYDGWLCELFCEKDLDLPPESGTHMLEVEYVSFEFVKPNLIAVEYSDKNGVSGKMFIALRSEGSGFV
jgi:hypothetical protein